MTEPTKSETTAASRGTDRNEVRPGDRTTSTVSRRGFLGIAGAAAMGGAGVPEVADQMVDPELEGILLTRSDLVGRDSYVEWHVEPRTAPLPTHLRERIPSFTGAGAATGFVSDGTAGLPKYIESAVYPGTDHREEVIAATTNWLSETHSKPITANRHTPSRTVWEFATGDEELDAVRLESVENLLSFTIVGGRVRNGVGPRSGAQRYARRVQERAQLR